MGPIISCFSRYIFTLKWGMLISWWNFCRFTRLLVFTLEVAIQTMGKNVEQFVLLFDASKFIFFITSLFFYPFLSLFSKMYRACFSGQLDYTKWTLLYVYQTLYNQLHIMSHTPLYHLSAINVHSILGFCKQL